VVPLPKGNKAFERLRQVPDMATLSLGTGLGYDAVVVSTVSGILWSSIANSPKETVCVDSRNQAILDVLRHRIRKASCLKTFTWMYVAMMAYVCNRIKPIL
jgi:protein-L-isoaspartate O-methyltransferase